MGQETHLDSIPSPHTGWIESDFVFQVTFTIRGEIRELSGYRLRNDLSKSDDVGQIGETHTLIPILGQERGRGVSQCVFITY